MLKIALSLLVVAAVSARLQSAPEPEPEYLAPVPEPESPRGPGQGGRGERTIRPPSERVRERWAAEGLIDNAFNPVLRDGQLLFVSAREEGFSRRYLQGEVTGETLALNGPAGECNYECCAALCLARPVCWSFAEVVNELNQRYCFVNTGRVVTEGNISFFE